MKAPHLKNGRAVLAVSLAAAAVVGATAWGVATAYYRDPGHSEVLVDFDPTDDRQVAGIAADVFHGTVLERTGHGPGGDHMPSETYRVRVDETFKGHLSGTVTVAQTIGSRPSLVPRTRYVFSTAVPGDPSLHYVLAEVTPPETPDLGSPAPADRPAAARETRTLREYWRWVVAHGVDVNTLPPSPAAT